MEPIKGWLFMFCDAHIHLLPNVDDGKFTVDECIAMLKILRENDCRQTILTPHFDAQKDSVSSFLYRRNRQMRVLSKLTTEYWKHLRSVPSAEVFILPGTSKLPQLEKLCVSGTNILPVVLPYGGLFPWVIDELLQLGRSRHFHLIVCHMERYQLLYPDDDYKKLILMPYITYQFTARALRDTKMWHHAVYLASHNRSVILGSNAHDAQRHPPMNSRLESIIEARMPASVYQNLCLQTVAFFSDVFS